MLNSNHQELMLQQLMNDIIRTDLAVLHRKKIANLVSALSGNKPTSSFLFVA